MQVAELNEEGNWRSGLRVRLMLRRLVCQNMVPYCCSSVPVPEIIFLVKMKKERQYCFCSSFKFLKFMVKLTESVGLLFKFKKKAGCLKFSFCAESIDN